MLYSNLVKRRKRRLIATILALATSFLYQNPLSAESITPSLTEDTLSIGQRSTHSITFENNNDYEIYLTPEIYKYYPQSEYVLDLEPYEEFIIIDTDYITIEKNRSKNITFQIVAPKSLDIGTYYNLIIFKPTRQNEEDDVIGFSGALSHLVQLNLTDDPNLEKITTDYNTRIEVVNRGIPFIQPAKLKFTFFNNSNYTLIPKGEIQVVKRNGNKEPEYIKINTDRRRVYPQDSIEFEYDVENWYLEDIFYGKTAYLKFTNGLDNEITTQEFKIPGFLNEFLYILASLTVIILLIASMKRSSKPEPKSSE